MINIKSNDIQLKHFLKADPYNEEYRIIRYNKECENRKIINGNKEFFENIALKYDEQPNEQNYIHWLNEDERVYSEKLDEWIKNEIYDAVNDTLIYVEGYAGCGKTTWVQSILYNNEQNYQYVLNNNNIEDSEKEKYKESYINFYESFTPGTDYSSDVIRFNIVNSMVIRMIHWIKEDSGIKILDDFCNFLSSPKISTLNNRLPNIIKPFKRDFFKNDRREETFFYKNARLLRNDAKSEENFIDIFRENINKKDKSTGKYIFSMMDILCIDCIWRLAQSKNSTSNIEKIYICYDNLDIIDDLEALALFINDLGNLKTNINKFRDAYIDELDIPYFMFFLTCRRITSAKLDACGSFLASDSVRKHSIINDPNEAAERDQRRDNIIKIDLSHLYNYEYIIKKRATYFKGHIGSLIDYEDTEKLIDALEKVEKLPQGAFSEINYSGLWNHNHRACNNVLSCIISNYLEYYNKLTGEYSKQLENNYGETISANTSILLHIIIKILNSNKEWEKSLGYKDSKLTTMSRLILTYMHNKKYHYNVSVSIMDIVREFGMVSIELDDIQSENDSITYICGCIQNMLTRLPNESEEIWRRPLYYKHNALVCNNNKIQNELLYQYKNQPEELATSFTISDEGSTFIEKIVPQFEFYSARLNDSSIPLFCINTQDELKRNIETVYNKVSKCCLNQIVFMERYIKKYRISDITEYLNKDFHPITIGGEKQLHIVRVIFAHIAFLNSFREYLYVNNDKRYGMFNKIIVDYIRKYLKLYDEKFYDLMSNTIGEYNNEVWNELVLKCNQAIEAINKQEKELYVTSIKRSNVKRNNDRINKVALLDFN